MRAFIEHVTTVVVERSNATAINHVCLAVLLAKVIESEFSILEQRFLT
jgi:hypothetical protein